MPRVEKAKCPACGEWITIKDIYILKGSEFSRRPIRTCGKCKTIIP